MNQFESKLALKSKSNIELIKLFNKAYKKVLSETLNEEDETVYAFQKTEKFDFIAVKTIIRVSFYISYILIIMDKYCSANIGMRALRVLNKPVSSLKESENEFHNLRLEILRK